MRKRTINRHWRRVLACSLLLVMCLLLAACGDKAKAPSASSDDAVIATGEAGSEADAPVQEESVDVEEPDSEAPPDGTEAKPEPSAAPEGRQPEPQAKPEETGSAAEEEMSAATYDFPESLQPGFHPVESVELEPITPVASWELLSTLTIGYYSGEPISLEIYRPTGSEEVCTFSHEAIGILVYRGQPLRLPECVPNDLADDAALSDAVIWLGHEYRSGGQHIYLHGTIALAANGPGRIGILYQDVTLGRWYMIGDWGKPMLADMDGDAAHELVLQFEGLHLSWPDVTIYRWHQGSWERSDRVAQLLDVPEQTIHLARLVQASGRFAIELQVFLNPDLETPVSARYAYQGGILTRLNDGDA